MKHTYIWRLTALYVVILAHFLFSNFIFTLGPRIVLETPAYINQSNTFTLCQPKGRCAYSCPAFQPGPYADKLQGFPFATNDFWTPCGSIIAAYNPADFTEARLLNVGYITLISVIYGCILYKLGFRLRRGKKSAHAATAKAYVQTFAKYAGLATICFEWLAIILFYIFRPVAFSGENPISYFASFPETRLTFSVCLTAAALSFWIFTTYHLPKYYVVPIRLFAISMLAYAILALAPFDPNNATSETVHRILALFFSLTFLAGIFCVGKYNKDTQVRRASYGAVILSTLILGVFLMAPEDSHYILLLEASSAFVGQLWVVWMSLHSFKREPRKDS